jgi:hypothetical protein
LDRAPCTPVHGDAAAQSAALRRVRELSVELTAALATLRTRLAELEAAEPAIEEVGLGEGEMRGAFATARAAAGSGGRPRWADTLLRET